MTKQEKLEKIKEIQKKKENIKPEIKEAFEKKKIAFEVYNDINFKWLNLKSEYELLDREEKLIKFSITGNKKSPKRTSKKIVRETKKDAEDKALKALESLSPEMRRKIFKRLKESFKK